MEIIFDDIEIIECVSDGWDDYVYDIEVEDDSHTFIANDILVHNSLYMSYENLLKTIDGYENMSEKERVAIVVKINQLFLNKHNQEFMDAYYKTRHAKSIHEFELETCSMRTINLKIKKRYAKAVTWEDGKWYDDPKIDAKGLEFKKASYPSAARKIIKELVQTLLLTDLPKTELEHKMVQLAMQKKQEFYNAPIETICQNVGCNNYQKYIISDDDPNGLQMSKGCPFAVAGLGLYNWYRNVKGLPGEPHYGGKMKCYAIKAGARKKKSDKSSYFCFAASEYPKWADQECPIDKKEMFKKTVLDPINRILEDIGMMKINIDGAIQVDLFGMF